MTPRNPVAPSQPRIGSLSAEDREELDAVFIAYLRNQRNEQAARIAELEGLLTWMHNKGGLGLDVHDRIHVALSPKPAGETK